MKKHVFHSPLVQTATNSYRLCYSLHSSYDEINEFIGRLNAKHIEPIASPINMNNQCLPSVYVDLLSEQTTMNHRQQISSDLKVKFRYESMDRFASEFPNGYTFKRLKTNR